MFLAAHEYGHAYHHKALGGLWRTVEPCSYSTTQEKSYECALQEGFAHYTGVIGSEAVGGLLGRSITLQQCFEDVERCFGVLPLKNGRKGRISAYVAALFVDLTDDRWEKGDWTEYPGRYVAEVFKTCRAQRLTVGWEDRSNVSDIVWCLEKMVTRSVHKEVFPDLPLTLEIEEEAMEPPDWRIGDIRRTWEMNLK